MIVFPGNRIDGKQTINGARGFNRKIADRFDLTIECIRRHYIGQRNPLGETLARYRDFFALFEDFRGYVEFFMLQDLVTDDCSSVRFFMPFDDFKTPSVPSDVDTYKEYRRLSIESSRLETAGSADTLPIPLESQTFNHQFSITFTHIFRMIRPPPVAVERGEGCLRPCSTAKRLGRTRTVL